MLTATSQPATTRITTNSTAHDDVYLNVDGDTITFRTLGSSAADDVVVYGECTADVAFAEVLIALLTEAVKVVKENTNENV